MTGGARGPGVFFVIPCVDVYEKIDLRTATYEIPPQEVSIVNLSVHQNLPKNLNFEVLSACKDVKSFRNLKSRFLEKGLNLLQLKTNTEVDQSLVTVI